MSTNKSEDLFGDSSSDGTDDLLAEASSKKPVARKKGGAKKLGAAKRKRDTPDADLDDSDDDDDGSGGGVGLFDSDDSDDDDGPAEKPKKAKKLKKKSKDSSGGGGSKKKKEKKGGGGGRESKMSKKEKMAALAKRRAIERGDIVDTSGADLEGDDERRKNKDDDDDGDSYDSREFVRTKEDDDFIDASGEDPEALEELYREQHFDDERPDGSDSEDDEGRRKKKRPVAGRKSRARGPDALSDDDLKGDEPPDNPIMAAVHKMKRRKKEVKKLSELEDEAREFLRRMDEAADEDEAAMKERRPGLKKLKMLPEVLDMLAKQNMMRPLLDHDLLSVCRRWVQPLPKGGLGNVTLRQQLLQAIGNMSGENGVKSEDLKRSGFGKTVMALYMHKSETPTLKRQHKAMIERWSRPIFKKSGDMRDLEDAHKGRRADAGIVGYHRAAAAAAAAQRAESSPGARGRGGDDDGGGRRDISSIIHGGDKSAKDSVNNRVRVPFSKGFQFTVRPSDRSGEVRDSKTRMTNVKGQREGLHKRMIEKGRPVNKNQRSANISIEGRVVK